MFEYSKSELEKKSSPSLPYNMKPSGLRSILIRLVTKGSDRGASLISSGNSSLETLAVQNYLVFRDGPLEVVGKVRFGRMQSI